MFVVVIQDSRGICRVEFRVRNRREDQNISDQLVFSGNVEFVEGVLFIFENWNDFKL